MFDAIAGAIVGAVVGGVIAWYVAYWQLKRTTQAAVEGSRSERRHSARLAVEAVIAKIEDSELYRVSPHQEIWDKGFPSLNQTRLLFQDAKRHLRAIQSADLLGRIEKFEDAHRPIIQLRDSFESFMASRKAEGVHRIAIASEWPDLDRAADELRRLQVFINRELGGLKNLAASTLSDA